MEAAAQTILSNDGLLLSEEYRLLSGVGGEVAELRDDMASPPHAIRGRGRRRGLLRPGVDEAAVRARAPTTRRYRRYVLRIKSRPSDGMHAQAIGFGHLTASPATSTPWAPVPSPSSPSATRASQAMVSLSEAFEASGDLKVSLKRVLQQVAKDKTNKERGIKEEGNEPRWT